MVKTYWENGDALIQSIRTGEVWIAEGWEQAGWKLYEENKDIDWTAPKSGAMAWIDTFALPSKSENVEGAYKWINFSRNLRMLPYSPIRKNMRPHRRML